MSSLVPTPDNYRTLLGELKQRIRAAQHRALRQVNTELIGLYLDVGQLIAERQEGGTWGKSIVETLARDLQCEFPGTVGFSVTNLWRMKQFWEAYGRDEKLAPLVREIGWSHNVVILERLKDPLAREFYLRLTRKFGCTHNVLLHQIDTNAYSRTLRSQTNFLETLPAPLQAQAQLAVKDEYTFHFLELEDAHNERELERAIVQRIPEFLREMGGLFTFVGTQYRLELKDREYFIDLLLYHRRLRCMVAVELKVGEFSPEYVGKMQFYLTLLDETVRMPGEEPSIGIILCRSKDHTVEYALRDSGKPIGVATYRISLDVPPSMQGELPTPAQISKLLEGIGT